MKKGFLLWMCTFFCALNFLFADESFDEEEREESRAPIRSVKELVFEPQASGSIAYILLSDQTIWEKKCTPEEEVGLPNWKSGDEIYITTDNQEGICLENIRDLSTIYAQIYADSLNTLPKIVNIEVIEGGWFSSTEYYIHLSDRTTWRVITWAGELSNRWAPGQKVLLSQGWLRDRLVNLTIPFERGAPDDRSLLVE